MCKNDIFVKIDTTALDSSWSDLCGPKKYQGHLSCFCDSFLTYYYKKCWCNWNPALCHMHSDYNSSLVRLTHELTAACWPKTNTSVKFFSLFLNSLLFFTLNGVKNNFNCICSLLCRDKVVDKLNMTSRFLLVSPCTPTSSLNETTVCTVCLLYLVWAFCFCCKAG